MRVKEKPDGHIKSCTCLICLTKFHSETIEFFCDKCFKLNSNIQLKAIIETNRSFEDFMIDRINEAKRTFGEQKIDYIELTQEENDELYKLYKDRLKNPLPKDEVKTFMGTQIKIIK